MQLLIVACAKSMYWWPLRSCTRDHPPSTTTPYSVTCFHHFGTEQLTVFADEAQNAACNVQKQIHGSWSHEGVHIAGSCEGKGIISTNYMDNGSRQQHVACIHSIQFYAALEQQIRTS
eukprot:TRINITY_DN1285_c0_g1_i3.p1 TRINITY_DN1285_c0_g1~~TRINITY_DN1285_c0_g1_i3.p1  ORF type:complete len:118 (-),score=10.70 TRINITY_DN1285_c0_g1_i3:226-579(-)